jgi:putative ABC transport system substrate-binding protein
MNRRELIAVVGCTAAAPLAAQTGMRTIGFLNPQTPEVIAEPMRGLRQGLKDAGFVEGENLNIEYRWADNQTERLPTLSAELVHRQVALLIATGGAQSALAARAATKTIPIVFNMADDPVSLGLVASVGRPGGNLTGVTILVSEVTAKRLELLHEVLPRAVRVAVLSNPSNPTAAAALSELEQAAHALNLQLQVFGASTSRDIDAAFATFVVERPDALFVTGDSLFLSRRVQLAVLAAMHRMPATFALRDFVEAGGLMSYGASLRDAHRLVGTYGGMILKGAKPAELPVVQASKFELIINNQTARMLELAVPRSVIAVADEIIE